MITIIGGGVFGLTIGWYLAREGRRVTLVEQGTVGHGATWVAAGMLMPWKLSASFSLDLFTLQRKSHELWPEFVKTLATAAKVDLHYHTNGRYFLALDKKASKRFQKQFDYHQQQGFPLEWLSGDEVRCREPYLGPQIMSAMFSPLGHRVDNRQMVLALSQAFLQAGGNLQEQTPVQGVVIKQSRVQGVRLADKVLPSETVIVATGAWSRQLKGLPAHLQGLVEPIKGQTLTLKMSPDSPLLQRPVIGPVYLVPRSDGRLIVGTTVEDEAGFDTRPTVAGVYHILRKAQDIIPAVETLPIIEMSAGLRPTAHDRKPILGSTEIKGLIMAMGGHSYGILLSPIVAQSICHLVQTGQTAEVIAPFTAIP